MLKGLGGLGDMAKMMKQAQEVQAKMAAAQDSLAAVTVEGEAGAGLVKVVATARGEVTGLTIDPTLFEPGQKEVVEDLIVAAIKDAQARGKDAAQAEMRKVAEDMGLPPGLNLPF